jgi:hypothetical protein
MRAVCLLALLVLPLSRVVAQGTRSYTNFPDELAIASVVVLQDADEFQSTVSFDFLKDSERKIYTGAAEFEYGLTERWEVDVGVPYEFIKPKNANSVNGIGDVETGVRYGVVPVSNSWPYAVSAGLGFGIPTGDRTHDLGEGRLTLGPSFTASTWLGRVNVEFNGAWQHAVSNGGEARRDDFDYNVAVLYPISRWFLGLEGDGESNRDRTTYYLTPELIWKTGNLNFLIAVPVGVTHASADYGIVASVTLELEHVTHPGADKD